MQIKRTLTVLFVALPLLLTGCGSSGDSNGSQDTGQPENQGLFFTASDYETGNYGYIEIETLTAATNLGTLSADMGPAVYHNGYIYTINRMGQNNVTGFDPANLSTPLGQFSTGDNSNPHDIEFVGDKAYISRYDTGEIWVVDVSDPNPNNWTLITTIDISAFDADQVPDMTMMAAVGSKVFVALQLQDNYTPAANGIVLVIDADTDSLIDTDPTEGTVSPIILTGGNPLDLVSYNDTVLVVEASSGFVSGDGGIEVIDPDTYDVSGFIVTETQFGGNMGYDALLVSEDAGYVVVDSDWNDWGAFSLLYSFDLNGDYELIGELGAMESYVDPAFDSADGLLYVGVRSYTAPGISIYDTVAGEWILEEPISTGLPPISLCLF